MSSNEQGRLPHTLRLQGRSIALDAAATCWISALVAVPVLIGLVSVLELHTPFRFLLFPPLAALAFAVFCTPDHPNANMRGIVVAPTLTSAIVLPLVAALGTGATAAGAAVLITILVLRLLHVTLVPPLALAVLMILLRLSHPLFVVSVFIGTALLWGVFTLWKRLLLDRLHPPAHEPSG